MITLLGVQIVLGAPAASAADCGQAPEPQTPGAGLVGSIDPTHPIPNLDPYQMYDLYGYAGLVWYTYQATCGPLDGLTNPTKGLDTDVGNFLFNGAKVIVGTTSSLDRAVTDSSLMSPIYKAVETGANRFYNNVFLQLLAVCALLLSLVLLRAAWRGDLAAVSRRTLTMLGGLWLAASSLVLLRYLEPVDKAVVGFSTDIQAGFTPDASTTPAGQQYARDLHENIIYTAWLRGEFGAPDVPQAAQYGRPLLDAQAFTVTEVDAKANTDQAVIDRKKQSYTDIAGKLGASTDTFTGDAGGRAGAGLLALLQAVSYALFPLLAKLTVLLAQVIFRLIIITSPLLGLAALLHPEVLRILAKVAATVLFNLLVVSVLAGTHTLIMQAVFGGNLPVTVQLLIAVLVTGILWGIARPLRRLRQTLQAPTHALGDFLPRFAKGDINKPRSEQAMQKIKGEQGKAEQEASRNVIRRSEGKGFHENTTLATGGIVQVTGPSGEVFSVAAGHETFAKHEGLKEIIRNRVDHKVGKRKTIAILRYEIDGEDGQLWSASGTHRYTSTSPNASASPTPEDGWRFDRGYKDSDAEWKLLEDLATRLKPSSQGTVHIVSERGVCPPCREVIDQFRRAFPGITITYSDVGVPSTSKKE